MLRPNRTLEISFWLVILLVPLFLGLMWGLHFDDPVYDIYIAARNLAAGRGLADGPTTGAQTLFTSPLFVAILAFFGSVAAPPWVGLILSALGWGAAACIIYLMCLRLERPLAAVVAALLIAFSPLIFLTSGGTDSWIVALLGTIMLWSRDPHLKSKVGRIPLDWMLCLLLGIHFDLSTAAFVLFLGLILRTELRWSRLHLLVWLLVIGAWGAIVTWQLGVSGLLRPPLQGFDLPAITSDSELYWLFAPLLILGVFALARSAHVRNKRLWIGFVWLLFSALVGSPIAFPLTAVTGLFLVGLGIEWFVHLIVEQRIFRLPRSRLTATLTVLLMSPLLFAQVASLWQLYRARPSARLALEEQAADWLQRHSEPEATIFASRRVGYLADRATIPADIDGRTSSEWADLFALLMDGGPDFILSWRTIDWSFVTSAGWFQERYQSREEFTAAYAPTSPVTIWQYAPGPFDVGEIQAADATVSDKLKLVGYKYTPQQIAPGDDIYVTLQLQATQPITAGFNTAIFLVHPIDGEIWAWQDAPTPRAIPTEWWRPKQVVAERFRIPTESRVPFGAYKLELTWRTKNEANWPVYRDDDTNVLDRLLLGYVAVPPPVEATDLIPVNVRFGDQIMLSGLEIIGDSVPGETIEIVLYWEALRPPDDNYAVFVHLLDQAGQLITSHDGQPMENRFPTRGWLPGTVIRDTHPLSLPSDITPGEYQVNVGLYLQQTGARLPIWDEQGIEQPDNALPLLSIEIE